MDLQIKIHLEKIHKKDEFKRKEFIKKIIKTKNTITTSSN
jgi:hypothetical protein